MRPISLRLKGFLGIKSGMGLDEVTIDFSKLPGGLIVFDAPTGSGKTTILDNMTMYRIMPFQIGDKTYSPDTFSYYGHTYGDAEKEFVCEMDGVKYRSLLLIDTDRKKTEAYLWHWGYGDPGKWMPEPGIDGKLGSYDAAVERVMGSPSLYFTSIFRAQNAKALSDYTKGSIKDLLIELLNIEHIQAIGEKARRVKQDLSGKVELLMFDRKRLNDTVSQEQAKREDQTLVEVEIANSQREIERLMGDTITLQEQINECDVQISMMSKRIEEKARLQDEAETKKKQIVGLKSKLTDKEADYDLKVQTINSKIDNAKKLIEMAPSLRKRAHEKATYEEKLSVLRKDMESANASHETSTRDLLALKTVEVTIKDLEGQIQRSRQKREFDIRQAEKALSDAEMSTGKLEGVPCSEDTANQCRFIKDAVTAKKLIPSLKEHLDILTGSPADTAGLEREVEELKAKTANRAAIEQQLQTAKTIKADLNSTIAKLEAAIRDATKALEILPRVELAENSIPEYEQEIIKIGEERLFDTCEIDMQIDILQTDIEGLANRALEIITDNSASEKKAGIVKSLTSMKQTIDQERSEENSLRQKLGALQEALRQIESAKTELEGVNARITFLNDEISQWAILEKGFGKDGVIPLEIDDAGPQISAYTNDLLNIYDSGYSVKITTQEAKANNDGNKEVFDILVYDPVLEAWKSIKRTSGGQRALYEDAVTKAISIYNKTASDRNLKTTFTDEKDSALDMELRKYYFAVKRRVLELGGFDQEYCITHTPELKAMADAVIKLDQGKVEIITN